MGEVEVAHCSLLFRKITVFIKTSVYYYWIGGGEVWTPIFCDIFSVHWTQQKTTTECQPPCQISSVFVKGLQRDPTFSSTWTASLGLCRPGLKWKIPPGLQTAACRWGVQSVFQVRPTERALPLQDAAGMAEYAAVISAGKEGDGRVSRDPPQQWTGYCYQIWKRS